MNVLDVAARPGARRRRRRRQPRPARRPVPRLRGRRGLPTSASVPGSRDSFPRGRPAPCPAAVYVVEPIGDEVFVEVLLGEARVSVSAPRGFRRRSVPRSACAWTRLARASSTPDGTTAVHRSSVIHPARTARSARKWKGFCHEQAIQHVSRRGRAAARASPPRRQAAQASPCSAHAAADPADQEAAPHRPRAVRARPQVRGKLVIGAFEDGALTPFKQTILPMFEQATGIKVQFLTEPYDSFFAKAFQDGQSKAGQYDIYIMDDPWVPQYAAAGILEDLGAHGITADSDFAPPFVDLGYWPPQKGPRIKGFENDDADADRPADDRRPADAHLSQRRLLRGARRRGTSSCRTAQGGVAASKIKYGFVFRGVKGNPIVTSFYPVFLSLRRPRSSTTSGTPPSTPRRARRPPTSSSGTLKSIAPPGVAEFDSDQEGAAILGGDAAAIIQYSGNAIKSDDPSAVEGGRQARLRRRPEAGEARIAQIGIFIHGVSASAPNKDNAITFMKWYASNETAGRAGPLGRPAGEDPGASPTRRRSRRTGCCPTALAQLQSGRGGAAAHARLGEGRVDPRHRAQQGARRRQRRRGGAWTPRPARCTDYLKAAGLLRLSTAWSRRRRRTAGQPPQDLRGERGWTRSCPTSCSPRRSSSCSRSSSTRSSTGVRTSTGFYRFGRRLRDVGLDNYAQALHDPAFLELWCHDARVRRRSPWRSRPSLGLALALFCAQRGPVHPGDPRHR